MTDNQSFFFDEWRDCLHSHYLYVVQTEDHVTEPTLRNVLMDAGVREDEIDTWYREALGISDIVIEETVMAMEEQQLVEDSVVETIASDESFTEVASAVAIENDNERLIEHEQQQDHEETQAQNSDAGDDEIPTPPENDHDDSSKDMTPYNLSLFDF